MHVQGHVGAALLAYSPVAFVLVAADLPGIAIYGCLAAVALSTLPDVDRWLPIPHRGPTHTVWFVGAVVATAALLGWTGMAGTDVDGPRGSAFLGTVALAALGSHVLVDVFTPMGIRPFVPLTGRSYSLNLVESRNPLWNRRLLAVGTVCAVAAIGLGVLVG